MKKISRKSKPSKSRYGRAPAKRAPFIQTNDSPGPPWAVNENVIIYLDDQSLRNLMNELIRAEAYLCRANLAEINIAAELKAPDDGCDGHSPRPEIANKWLQNSEVCWQFKSGTAGQRAKLKGEVVKPIPSSTLRSGGWYIVVASAASGHKGVLDREAAIKAEAKRKHIPTDRIRVLGSEHLASWLREHPTIAMQLRGQSNGFCQLSEWEREAQHKEGWIPTDNILSKLSETQKGISSNPANTIPHVHIYGRPGVGKTRFALELCKSAEWKRNVLYAPQGSDPTVLQLLNWMSGDQASHLVLVADEVRAEQLKDLGTATRRSNGRVSLITIGHDKPLAYPDMVLIEVLPLDPEKMRTVIHGWFPLMPDPQVDFIVTFSDGFVRLARMAAIAIDKNPNLDTSSLLASDTIRSMMDTMLGNLTERGPLHVLAALKFVGWYGDRESEGRMIAGHFEFPWLDVQRAVQRHHDNYGIAPRIGDMRYISPTPLGTYLFLEAVKTYPDKVRELGGILPTTEAKQSHNQRLQSVASSPLARAFADDELAFFFRWDHFLTPEAVDRWSALAFADSTASSKKMKDILELANHDEKLLIKGAARRTLVRTLVDIAWSKADFYNALLALGELAVSENETWSNNATGEFESRFQVILGGTETPFSERLSVIDTLLDRKDAIYQILAARALLQSLKYQERRSETGTGLSRARPPEWHPNTDEEYSACLTLAIERLEAARSKLGEDATGIFIDAVKRMMFLCRRGYVREPSAKFIKALVSTHPGLREPIRQIIFGEIELIRSFPKNESVETLRWFESIHGEYSDPSPAGQLRQALVRSGWNLGTDDLEPLVEASNAEPSIIESNWQWLTSGDAKRSWELGILLAAKDEKEFWLKNFISFPNRGTDLRIIAGYITERAKSKPKGWIDNWLDEYQKQHPDDVSLLFDLSWRCASTNEGARRIATLIQSKKISVERAHILAFGGWCLGPEIGPLRELIEACETAGIGPMFSLEIIEHRTSKVPADWMELQAIALRAMQNIDVIRSGTMGSHYWASVAMKLIPKYTAQIVDTIFRAQVANDDAAWFIEHSEASGVLSACTDAEPTTVWKLLKAYLEVDDSAHRFLIGFPKGIIERLGPEEIFKWIDSDPKRRATTITSLLLKDLNDGSLAAKILDRYGHLPDVHSAFVGTFWTGHWMGPASKHWSDIAQQLEDAAAKSTLPGVRKWAISTAGMFRREAKKELKREEERLVRG